MEKSNNATANPAKTKRSRNWSLTTYIGLEAVEAYVQQPHIKNYAYIMHDKDVWDKDIVDEKGEVLHHAGDLKEPHIHLVISFLTSRTFSAVKNDFANYEQNTLCEMVRELEASYDYLTHARNKEKYQYDRESVVTNIGYFRGDISLTEDNTAYQIVNAINTKTKTIDLVRKFGREYVINQKNYHLVADKCAIECDMETHSGIDETTIRVVKRIGELKKQCNPFRQSSHLTLYVATSDGVMEELGVITG